MIISSDVGSAERPLRVAIIGAGPAAFYLAGALLKKEWLTVHIDLFERLPTPYGLVRGGVAPDHESIKAVSRVFQRTAKRRGVRFFGNVTFGRDLRLGDLQQHYDQIVFAVGNEKDRGLGVPGEDLRRCVPAGRIVGWYNGHPDYREVSFDLSVSRVAVIGNGNVALDIARILAHTPEELETTDIADYALEALRHSAIREITVLGRRGPAQASFTPQELKEFAKLAAAQPVVAADELQLDPSSEAAAQDEARVKRNIALLCEFAERGQSGKPKKVRFRFFLSPREILDDGGGGVGGLRLERNRLVQRPDGSLRAQGTGLFERLEVDMVVRAIGFFGIPLPDVPFDAHGGVIRNLDGRVAESDATVVPNHYVVGWARSGPKGLIGSHKGASEEVAKKMLEDLSDGRVEARERPPESAVEALLKGRGVVFVDFADWKRLEETETERGAERGAPREKVTEIDEMLSIMGKQRTGGR